MKSLLALAVLNCSQTVLAEQVDLLLLYDQFTSDRYNGAPLTTMTSWVNNMNAAYAASDVDIQLRLVGLEYYEPSATDISSKLTEIRSSNEVDNLRDQYGADFVSLVSSLDGNVCGIGYFSVSSRNAFNVSAAQCGYLTMIHELGHNMGLAHSRRQGDNGGARYGYGIGYGIDNEFSTIMAYPQAFRTNTRLNRFSDPDSLCEGYVCGVEIGDSEESDSHTALNNVINDIANFRDEVGTPTPVATPTPTPVATPTPTPVATPTPTPVATPTPTPVATPTPTPVVTPTPAPAPVEVIAPSDLQVSTASDDSINLSWSDNSSREDLFEIQRSVDSDNDFESLGSVGRGSTSYLDQNLSAGTYYYRVRASKEGVLSDFSNVSNTTIEAVGEPTVPEGTGEGLNLLNLGFRLYTTQRGSDARAYLSNDGTSLSLQNNVWVATSTYFTVTEDTVLSFDYSSNVSGEIHGIGLDENSSPSTNRMFKLGGTQNWGISDYQYTANGDTQHFDIPVGQYYTGRMRLVMANDNDAGSGNVGYFSNISLTGSTADVQADASTPYVFGMEYIDSHTATIYHEGKNQPTELRELCLNDDCDIGEWNNGRYERQVNVTLGESYLLEYRAYENNSECSVSTLVTFDINGSGQASSSCK